MKNYLIYRIALRYIVSRKANRFISFISVFSITGIALGVIVIITVFSVMNGFRAEIRDKILNFTSHGLITGISGTLTDWRALPKSGIASAGVLTYAPFVETQVMLLHDDRANGVYLRGVDPSIEEFVGDIGEYLTHGRLDSLQADRFRIILGADLARYLNARIGDKLTLISPQGQNTPVGTIPRLRRFTVSGIFDIGMSQYDRNVALVSLEDAQKLVSYGSSVDGVHFAVDDIFQAPRTADRLRTVLGPDYRVRDWTQQHRSFFRALEMEKLILGVLLTFIILVAAFNVVATLVMLVTEKRADIAILKTLGLAPSGILKIFMAHGCMLGLIGVATGVIGGVLLSLYLRPLVKAIESFIGQPFLSKDVYPIAEVPALLQPGDVAFVACVTLALVLLATLYPAWHASRLLPARVLKAE